MAHSDTPGVGENLQFDRVLTDSGSAPPPMPTVVCSGCRVEIKTQYYDVNGAALCGHCRAGVAAAAETPRGMAPFLLAAAFGAGAGVAGAAIYYAVIAIAHLEIGIVAILIGYMVGYSVRRGAHGRGGRRFQVLAAALTYMSVALAYAPLAIQQAMSDRSAAQAAVMTRTAGDADASTQGAAIPAPARPGGSRRLLGVAVLSGLMLALPVLVVIGSFPYGLISAFIIFIGMRQAWRMTRAEMLRVFGPYRVGVPQAETP